MVRVFLTGGSGLLGNNILRAMKQREWQVQALIRKSTDMRPFEGLAVEFAHGDLHDANAIDKAIQNCDVVVHSAAHIHIGWKFRDEAMRINQGGTQVVVDAALKHRKPLLHVSTVNTLAIGQRDQPATESSPGDGQTPSTYVLSKRAAEEVVRRAMIDHHLQSTIVYPGFMLGPYDWKPSSGRMVLEVSKRCPPMSPSGGCSVCDARDVASAIVTIIDRSLWNERFILAGQNLTYFELWKAIAARFGKRGPMTVLRKPGQVVVGFISDWLLSRKGTEADTNSAAIKMGSQFHYYDSEHAHQKLGYQTRSFEETMGDTIAWLQENTPRSTS